ncbi:toll/interleukin-1 receptor domain-containing protein [Corallococcus exercitus]|uniref:Toll/interleukin-1 receptor domain-containing protein n=1 Tax=Corallococcus exercitus TaxID=2316736 RepID=A0A7Y4JMK9_9BACT|nr:toll/interleukin-1 receptor domain-containing protein [Corallococcus exercitus]NOK07499.1 toll/interleukin-1 receptor domain-containing protein [Corallococcus exercitus]
MRVFISHSSQPDSPRDAEYLNAVDTALRTEFEVLLDRKSIEANQEWPCELNAYMDECHVAVLLVSRNALQSDWVNREAAILAWRRALEQDFQLLTVPLGGVTRDEILKHGRFSAMELGRWQFIPSGDPAEVAERILTHCRAHAPQPDSTPMDQQVLKLSALLADSNHDLLCMAATELGMETAGWGARAHEKLARGLARRLADAGPDEQYKVVLALDHALDEGQIRRLLRGMEYLWVPAAAAGRIPPLVANVEKRSAIGLNGKRLLTFTGRNYVDRAYRGKSNRDFILIDSAIGQQPLQEITQQIEKYFESRDIRRDEISSYLESSRTHYFVLVPAPVPDLEVFDALVDQFPQLTFFFGTGLAGHDDPRVGMLPRLVALEPVLSPDLEHKAWSRQKDFEVILNNVSR